MHPLMGKSLVPLLEGTTDVVHPADEAIGGEMFNNTSVRMGDWKATSYGVPLQWKLFNLKTDLGESTDLASQHPDILQKLIAEYDKYSQEVGNVIPRGAAFEQTAKNNFPPIGNDPQTIGLADMLVPGYPLNETEAPIAVVN